MAQLQPGPIIYFGSGETSASGRQVWEWLFRRLDRPIRVSILETPAGFELNSAAVAGRIARFLEERLQNYRPQVTVVPARKRGTLYSPDNAAIVAPLAHSNVIFLGPGSPTYAVRQLRASLAWHLLLARQRLGAAVVLASAAAIAASRFALPVYEIYKVGQDPHWQPGLDLLAAYGLAVVVVPHWDNREGGEELDTSHCFMGQERFQHLLTLLPPEPTVVGIDEHTALVLNLAENTCQVLGRGHVHLLQGSQMQVYARGERFGLAALGRYRLPDLRTGIPEAVWRQAMAAQKESAVPTPPAKVMELVRERERARRRRDWSTADAIRDQIVALGWRIQDTRKGPQLQPLPSDPNPEKGANSG